MPATEEANARLVDDYIAWMRDVRGCRPSSVYSYSTRLNMLVSWLGNTPLGCADVSQLEAWVGRIRGGRAHGTKGAAASRATDTHIIRAAYGYWHARGLIERNPATLLVSPAVHNRNPKPVPEHTWRRLWTHPDLPSEASVVLGLGFFCGLRRSEIVSLSPSHFDQMHGRIVGFVRKGGDDDVLPYAEMVAVFADHHPSLIGQPERFLGPLHELVASRLGRPRLLPWREQHVPSAYNKARHVLAPNDIDPEWVNRRLRRWLKDSGVEPDALTPHALRHSCATYLLRAGMPMHLVSQLLNHSSMDVTRRYAKIGQDDVAAWRSAAGGAAAPRLQVNRFPT